MQDPLAWILLTHAGSTMFMVGLAWFVLVVHYPLFRGVPQDAFKAYEQIHVRRTTYVVMPVMLAEAATSAMLLLHPDVPLTVPGIVLLIAVWGLTFGVLVPLHRRLESEGPIEACVRRLVWSHGIRTLLWSARGIIALLMLRPEVTS